MQYVNFLVKPASSLCNMRCRYCFYEDEAANRAQASMGVMSAQTAELLIRQALETVDFNGQISFAFQGGEPTVQARALLPLVRRLHEVGIHVCLDSNGTVWNDDVESLLTEADLVLLDVKEINPERHRRLTGRDNVRTLQTADWIEAHEKPFWLRYVLVPGWSDFEEDLHALGERFKNHRMIERVELLPYHTLGVHKYEAMGWEYRLKGVKENTPEQIDRAAALLRSYFPQLVVN